MKIGPVTIERNRAMNAVPATTPSRAAPDFTERGAPGTQIFGGWMQQQDYNNNLQSPASYDIFDQMRLGDGQVRAGLAVVKLPILRAHWQVEAASDSAEDKMIAEFIETDLRSMTIRYIHYLQQALLMLDYGSMLFEPVWYLGDDGFVHLRKMAPRLPRTVYRWHADENGGFAGITQLAVKASGISFQFIEPAKLVLFVNEQEGSNFRGVSMLRAAYKHWYYKDGLYKVDAIAKEKRGVGIDVGTIKAGATDKDVIKKGLERALPTLHGHEKGYFIEDEENYTYHLETGNARVTDVMPSIEHHDLRILRSILAEHLSMGSGSTGSLAMHSDKTGFFLMALEATSDNLAETQTTYLIKPWVDYNWKVKEYPRMKYSRLDTRNTTGIAEAVNKLMIVGALTPSPDTEAELRVLLDLPELEIEPVQIQPVQIDKGEEPGVDPSPSNIAAIQERQVARVKELVAAGKPASDIRLPFKDELVAAIVGDDVEPEPPKKKITTFERDIVDGKPGPVNRTTEEYV